MVAIQDYANAFSVITLVSGGFSSDDVLALVRHLKNTGIPNLEDYFCIKYLGNGASMSSVGFEVWNMLAEDEKNILRNKFRNTHLIDADWTHELVFNLLEDDVRTMNRLLSDFWPEGIPEANVPVFLAELSRVAHRAVRRLRSLASKEDMFLEIEGFVESRASH